MLTHIDTERSIQTGKLHITGITEKIDYFTVILLGIALVIFPIWKYNSFGGFAGGAFDDAIRYFLLPLVILEGIYVVYKKINEKKLTKIDTGFDKNRNRALIVTFMEKEGYRVFKNDADIIIAHEESEFGSGWQFNILPDNGVVYASVLKLHPILRYPWFFDGNSMINELKKYIDSIARSESPYQDIMRDQQLS